MNSVPDFVTLPWKLERAAPPFEGQDIKYPESLVRHFLRLYTKRGDKVFDPFAGLGTTLFVAEEMKRVPYGIEYDEKRHDWVAGQLRHWRNLIQDDSAKMDKHDLPKMDFAMMSPPYMPRHHKWNPLFAGNPAKAGYDVYLRRMAYIFGRLAGVMKRDAHIVVQVDNLPGKVFTPLVWDIGQAAAKSFRLEKEIIVAWKNPKPDYSHTHCLVFKNNLDPGKGKKPRDVA